MKYVFGIDVGGTTVKIGKFNSHGNLLEKWEVRTNLNDSGNHILTDIYQSFIEHSINLEEVIGYGFGIPGPIVNGTVVQAVNLGWGNFDLALEFSKLVNNSNVKVNNDANVAAIGESFMGAAKGIKDVVMITLGTGVGGGIISDGYSIEGAFGAGGEIGHMVVNPTNGRLCNCGNHGCLETIASATGIKREFTHLMETSDLKTSLNKSHKPSAKAIFAAAEENDPLCLHIINKVAYYLGYACHVLSVSVNPEVIVFGGGVSRAGNFLLDKIDAEFRKYAYEPVQKTMLKIAILGNDAGMYGAASIVIND